MLATSAVTDRTQPCPFCGAKTTDAGLCRACGRTLPVQDTVPAAGSIARYVRCPACFTTVTNPGERCPNCDALFISPPPASAATPAAVPHFDLVGGCLIVVVLFLLYLAYLVWLLDTKARNV